MKSEAAIRDRLERESELKHHGSARDSQRSKTIIQTLEWVLDDDD